MVSTISPRLHPAAATVRVCPPDPDRPAARSSASCIRTRPGATERSAWQSWPTSTACGDSTFLPSERALRDHGLLVIPGLELTYSDDDPDAAVHAVAVGLRRFVGVDGGPRAAMAEARAAGAAIIAAHPHSDERDPAPGRTTRGVYVDPTHMRELVDRYELVTRHDVFPWVARERLPSVACGDAHLPEHVLTWKTLLTCDPTEAAVVAFLRSGAAAHLTRIDPPVSRGGWSPAA
jgi:hypothetical protein